MSAAHLGDFRTGKTVHFLWASCDANGASITRATNGTVSVYKDNGATQSTTGVTDTEDFDSLTGIHACTIDLSADGTFYSAGSNFIVVLSAATIDGQTVNAVLAHFSIENRSPLMPTTDGRKLDVSAGGEAGVDWANVGSPTTTVGLSGTTVKTATDVETDTQDIQSVVNSVTYGNSAINTNILSLISAIIAGSGSVNDVSATTTSFNTTLSQADNYWSDHLIVFTSGALIGQTRPIGDFANTNGVVTLDEALTSAPANGVTFLVLANHVHPVSQIADAVLDEATSGHTTAGTVGKLLADLLVDTNELQTDWANGGRLDLLVDLIINILKADVIVDTTQTPWDLVLTEPGTGLPSTMGGTGVVLLRQELKDSAGANLTSTDTIPTRQLG